LGGPLTEKGHRLRPFRAFIRITSIVSATALTLEGPVAVDTDVARLRRGDLNALSELIARYQNRLYRYLLRIVGQPAEAEDLFQQTWLKVVEKIRSFDESRNFDAWLFTLARNLAIDHLRRIRPQSLDEPLANSGHRETFGDRIPSRDHAPLDHALAAERRTRIGEAMVALAMIYREVLTLRFEDEMKIEEIARVTGVPVSTVKSRLRRSLEQLRCALEAQYPGAWR
jgi:RNA polymerase sigma-70 factor, ECF subfamily